tara:strand:+ start:214 stop:486 length:273 start_codon:yes stop_codon:yes gene_type:complete
MSPKNIFKLKFKEYLDMFLLLNLFLVIFSSFFFLVALIMKINGNSIFLNFFRRIWEPVILPTITILISSSLINAFIAWLRRRLPLQEEDI